MVYHVGIGKRGKTMVIEARRNVDYLSCEIYDYMGQREITKAKLHNNRYAILGEMQKACPGVYDNCRYAVID